VAIPFGCRRHAAGGRGPARGEDVVTRLDVEIGWPSRAPRLAPGAKLPSNWLSPFFVSMGVFEQRIGGVDEVHRSLTAIRKGRPRRASTRKFGVPASRARVIIRSLATFIWVMHTSYVDDFLLFGKDPSYQMVKKELASSQRRGHGTRSHHFCGNPDYQKPGKPHNPS